MTRTYTHLQEFFKLSTWAQDINGPFGLQGEPAGDWAAFAKHIEKLNSDCKAGEHIKVIYAARHGEDLPRSLGQEGARLKVAQHNANADKYGKTPEEKEAVQITHPVLDPFLTALGRSQAEALSFAFQREITTRGMPLPEKWFVSPLVRPGETCGIEWGWMFGDRGATASGRQGKSHEEDRGHGVPATVVENLREHLHVHLCDSRKPVHELKTYFPSFTYPENMDDEDTLYQPGEVRGRETEEELVERLGKAMNEVLDMAGDATYISITAHSGAIRGMYEVLGVPRRSLETGEMTILVVKVTESS